MAGATKKKLKSAIDTCIDFFTDDIMHKAHESMGVMTVAEHEELSSRVREALVDMSNNVSELKSP